MKYIRQSGFAVVPSILLAVIIVLVGIIGWRVYDMQKTTNTTKSQTSVTTQDKSMQTGENNGSLSTKADIDKAQSSLDAIQIDTDLDTSALDQDLDSLL